MLKYGADVDMTDHNGFSPLMFACAKGNTTICEILIENRCQVNNISTTFLFLIKHACIRGESPVVLVMLTSKPLATRHFMRDSYSPRKANVRRHYVWRVTLTVFRLSKYSLRMERP
jgi:ankyrin repeat protein